MRVARAGIPFDVDDDPAREDMRSILRLRSLGFSGSDDGILSELNDAGQLAIAYHSPMAARAYSLPTRQVISLLRVRWRSVVSCATRTTR
jgi:succinylarginine dihydrolase